MLTVRHVGPDRSTVVDAVEPRGGFHWVDVVGEGPSAVAALSALGLPALVVEDMTEDEHLPKIEQVDDVLSMTVHGLDVGSGRRLGTVELDLAMGEGLLVTFRRGPVASVDAIARHLDRGVDGHERPFDLLHKIVDVMNDVLLPVLDHFDARLEVIEDDLLDDPTERTRHDIFALRRDLVHLRRVVVPQAEVVRRLGRERPPGWREGDEALVRDLHDHLFRMVGVSDGYQQLLDSANDSYRAALDDGVNEMLTTLTVISAVLLPVSVVAGLWGMNVARVPGAETDAGFWWVLGGNGVLVAAMLLWFLRRGWIGGRAERAAAARRTGLQTVLHVPILGDVLRVPVIGGRVVGRVARGAARQLGGARRDARASGPDEAPTVDGRRAPDRTSDA